MHGLPQETKIINQLVKMAKVLLGPTKLFLEHHFVLTCKCFGVKLNI